MLCVSQESTAICVRNNNNIMDNESSSSSWVGGRAIDRHNPIICDGRRRSAAPTPTPTDLPCPSNDDLLKIRKSKSKPNKPNKSKAKRGDESNKASSSSSSAAASDLVTPASSSRYLLGDIVSTTKHASSCSSSSSHSNNNNNNNNHNQVVVLRVSLHCKGCEGKVRKHLSRMEGVTSFNIDFAAKKVTVVGDVSPVSVLASISKVKNAQILTSPPPPIPPPNLSITKPINNLIM